MARLPASIELVAAMLIAGFGSAACARNAGQAQTAETGSMTEATATAARAKEALDAGRFEEASGLYDQAIAAIGDDYARDGVLDDTGMKLTMARAQVGKGEWSSAANLKKSVVESRLALAAQR